MMFDCHPFDDLKNYKTAYEHIPKLKHITGFRKWNFEARQGPMEYFFTNTMGMAVKLSDHTIYEMEIPLCVFVDYVMTSFFADTLSNYLRLYVYQNRNKYSNINSVTILALVFRALRIETTQPGIVLKILHMNSSSKNFAGIKNIINEIKIAKEISDVQISESQLSDFILKRSEQPLMVMHKWMTTSSPRDFELLLQILKEQEEITKV